MLAAISSSPARNWEVFFPPGSRVLALPGWQKPRLLLAADTLSERVSGSAFYPAFRATGRLYRWALRLSAVAGIGVDRSQANGQSLLPEFLADVLPGAHVRAVQVGVPGKTCKLTAQLVNNVGRVVGYLKCAQHPVARQRLRREYALLRRLPLGAGPRALKYGSVAGHDVLLLDAVPGHTQKALLEPPPALRLFCQSLVGTTTYALAAHPWVQAYQNQSDGSARFLDALSGRSWPVAIQHGDLAPWNLIHHPERSLTAVDWEYGIIGGFPGLDLAQYVLQVAVLIKRLRPDAAKSLAIRHLLADESLALNEKEATALVALAAREAYRNFSLGGHPSTCWAQAWRRSVWERRVHA
jgi:hypothetical protein